MRIAVQAHCRYVLWKEDRHGERTLIVHPRHVHEKTGVYELSCEGFDHIWLVNQVKRVHGL